MAAPVIERARADIAAGRLWKARDRLTSAIQTDPADQGVRVLLGEVHFRMGDLPSAGRFWILTDHSGPEFDAALAAVEERWGPSLPEKLKVIPFRGDAHAYPERARARIAELEEQARAVGLEWPRQAGAEEAPAEGWSLSDGAVWGVLILIGPGLWALGVGAAIYLLVKAIA